MGSHLEQLEIKLKIKPIILYFAKHQNISRDVRYQGYPFSLGPTPRQIFMDVQSKLAENKWRVTGRSSDDFYILKSKTGKFAFSIFRLEPSKSDYIVAVYGDGKQVALLTDVMSPYVTPVEKHIQNAPIEFCIRYAFVRQAQLNAEEQTLWKVSDWSERASVYWDRLTIEGDDPVLEEELGRDMAESGLGDALFNTARRYELPDACQIVVDLAALHASPKTLSKFLRKQQAILQPEELATNEVAAVAGELEDMVNPVKVDAAPKLPNSLD